MATEPAEITIGFTESDPSTGYSSFDGYREGARQSLVILNLDVTVGADPRDIAESSFVATNDPGVVRGLARDIRTALQGATPFRSLSVGDTVTVTRPTGTVRLACNRYGWEPVASLAGASS